MNEAFRLSRIKAPRGTFAAFVLLALVLAAFGLLIAGLAPEQMASLPPRYFDGAPTDLANWLMGLAHR